MRRHNRVRYLLMATALTGAVALAAPTALAVEATATEPAAPAASFALPPELAAVVTTVTDQVEQVRTQITELINPQHPTEPGQPAGQLSSAEVVDQARSDLAAVGFQAPPVDAAVTDAVDQAAAAAAGAGARYNDQVEITQDIRDRFVEEEVVPLDPNYRWHMDPVAKVMAGKPQAEFILHRVPGSWFDAPRIPEESMEAQNRDQSLFGPGTPVYVGDSAMCTLGVVGTDSQGRKVGLTAGHCGQPGDIVASADSWQVGPAGTVVATNQLHDYSVIEFGSNAEITRTYNGVTVNQVGGPVAPGDMLCKQGVATGNTCGPTLTADEALQISQTCAMVGDSGGPVLHGDRMVGMISGGVLPNQDLSCRTPLQGYAFMPTVSTSMDNVVRDMDARGGVGAGFRLAD